MSPGETSLTSLYKLFSVRRMRRPTTRRSPKPSESDCRKWLASAASLSRSPCGIQRGPSSTTYSSPPRSPWPRASSRTFSTSTETGGRINGPELRDRVDRDDVEPAHRMHQDQPWLQTLLRRADVAPSPSDGPG